MNRDPINEKIATDLSKVKERAEEAERAKAELDSQKQAEAARERVAAWNKAMNRTFKGITGRRVREDLLRRALRRAEEEADDA